MKFKGENIVEFMDQFPDELSCQTYLAAVKWADGFTCKKCGHTKFTIRKKNQARDCNRCHHVESTTAGTLFHRVRFGLRKAFGIVFEMSATSKGLSSSQIAKRYSISRTTAWTFTHKVRKAMESSKLNPIIGDVQVGEFVFGGKESLKQGRSTNSKKKKLIGAVELTKEGKVKRTYFMRIEDYSSNSLRTIFDAHISKDTNIFTDKWTGYKPLTEEYNIDQKYSDKEGSMKQMHTIIHQLKSWLRSTYSWVHDEHIDKYLNEYSFRINRSIHKQTIFHNLISRMIKAKPFSYQMIKIST